MGSFISKIKQKHIHLQERGKKKVDYRLITERLQTMISKSEQLRITEVNETTNWSLWSHTNLYELSWWLSSKNFCLQWWRYGKWGFDPWVWKVPGERNGNPIQNSYLGNPMNREALSMGLQELDVTQPQTPIYGACLCVKLFQLYLTAILWTVACQASLSMEFPRQEYWRGCHALLQGIFLTQGVNSLLLSLLHWQAGHLLLTLPGKPIIYTMVNHFCQIYLPLSLEI